MGGTSSAVVTLFWMLTGLLVVFALLNWSGDHSEGALSEIQRRDLSETAVLPQQSGGLEKLQCNRTCGNITFPYPFGFSSECALNNEFQLECVYAKGVTGVSGSYELGDWPFLTGVANGSFQDNNATTHNVSAFQVLGVDGSDGTLVIDTTNIKGTACNVTSGGYPGNATILLPESGPYRSTIANIFAVVGCDSLGQLSDGQDVFASCGPNSCHNQYNFAQFPICGVYDCCTLSMDAMANIYLSGGGLAFADFPTCGYSSVLYPPSYSTATAAFLGDATYGMQLQWAVQVNETLYSNCSAVKKTPDYVCSPTPATCQFVAENVTDTTVPTLNGYYCACTQDGYAGDGYINGTGCDDIDECDYPNLNQCDIDSNATCINLLGSYNCSCPPLKEGDGFRNSSGCLYVDFCQSGKQNNCTQEARCISAEGLYNCTCPNGMVGDGLVNGTGCKSQSQTTLIVVGVVSSGAFLCVANGFLVWWLLRKWRRRHFLERLVGFSDSGRREFLRKIQSSEGANICKLFSLEELVQATNSFSNDRVVGTGGFGTVYQGTLADGTQVAVKLAKREGGAGGQDDTKQFINEVTILSQLNHRNLVKLLGCCLDTSIPILVYDFISNGNLQQHLKRSRPDPLSSESPDELSLQPLDWHHRLKIAIGTAEALSYLHSGTFPPIYHRDVKAANILLEDNYAVKVADFGLSKLVPVDATHLSTAMLGGTPGYMDPCYFDNFQITDKSDVYSFGVVLLELVTGEKPVDQSQPQNDQNLAIRCTRNFRDGSFEDMIDRYLDISSEPTIVADVLAVAEVAIRCVKREHEDRPSIKEVWDDLQKLSRPAMPSLLANNRRKSPRPVRSVRFDQTTSLLSEMSTNSEEFTVSSSNPESYSRSSSISLSTFRNGR